MKVYLVNPSDVSFGTAVITPRWLYVIAAATPKSFGDPILVDETLEQLDPQQIQMGDAVGISIHTGKHFADKRSARPRHGVFFGESCLNNAWHWSCTATAIEPSTISRIKRAHLVRIIHQDPNFTRLFISHLLFRIAQIQQEFVDQIFSSSEKRLARILLMLAGFGTRARPAPVLLKVSQETLAEMVGTTRSRISHFMNRFRKMGYIDYNGTLQVYAVLRTVLLERRVAHEKKSIRSRHKL